MGILLFPTSPHLLRVNTFLCASILVVHKLRVLVGGLARAGEDLPRPRAAAAVAPRSLPLERSVVPNTLAGGEGVAAQSWRVSVGCSTLASLRVVHDGIPIFLPPTLVSFGY